MKIESDELQPVRMAKIESAMRADGSAPSNSHLVVFVVNTAEYFFSHRLPVALEARNRGYEIAVAAGDVLQWKPLFEQHGISAYRLAYIRGHAGFGREILSVLSLARLVRRLRPAIIHAVTLKPIIHAIIASCVSRGTRVVLAVTGLGYLFIDQSRSSRLLRRLVSLVLRFGLRRPSSLTIFQNPDDRALFLTLGVVNAEQSILIRGSGVDVSRFAYRPEPDNIPLIVFPSRLVLHKGVREFITAAKLLKHWHMTVRCILVGDIDPENPTSLTEEELKAALDAGIVEAWGFRKDMPEVLAQAHIVCLPSYREGLPKALLEAASTGRAIVTTDVPGCREVVRDGENGFLVPVNDAISLAGALRRLVEDPALRKAFGKAGRARVVAEFAADQVATQTVDLYDRLMRVETRE